MKAVASREARRLGVAEGADREGRRMIILREAARLFTINGFADTKVIELARSLGVTKPTVYHYVESKEEMIFEVLRIGNERNTELLREARKSADTGLGQLECFLRGYAEAIIDDFGKCVILADPRTLSGRLQELHYAAYRLVLDELNDIIRRGIDDGSIRPCEPHLLTFALMGAFNSLSRWYRNDGPLSIDEVADIYLGFFESAIEPQA